jgi:hypothetical protein
MTITISVATNAVFVEVSFLLPIKIVIARMQTPAKKVTPIAEIPPVIRMTAANRIKKLKTTLKNDVKPLFPPTRIIKTINMSVNRLIVDILSTP